ncbi:MAG TPA: hypothetical protein VGW36_07655, partial [Pyrinomonadaceae bacterium]|nr:hypothetical protein [Pyrinomonadaceae bacterium]
MKKLNQKPLLVLAVSLSICAHAFSQSPEPDRHYGRATVNVERGVKIELGNRTTGRITVQGWDRDVIEARAVSPRGDEVVVLRPAEGMTNKRLFIKADYADLENPESRTNRVDSPPQIDGRAVKVHLEISVPRYTEIELIEVWRSDVEVSD